MRIYNPTWHQLAESLLDEIREKGAVIAELLSALEMIVEVFNLEGYALDSGGGKCYEKAQRAMSHCQSERRPNMTDLDINPDEIRKYFPGFIGGQEIADKANDAEVVVLVEWTEKAVSLSNRLREVEKFRDNLRKAIRSR